MQRMLCDLLRPSLEILSLRTSVNTGRSELEHRDCTTKKSLSVKPGVIVKNCDSNSHRSDTVDSKTAQSAKLKLNQLASMSEFRQYCIVGQSQSDCLICCK